MGKAIENMEEALSTYKERSKMYGDSYHKFGRVMHALFPDGIHAGSPSAWNRLGVLTQMVSKLTRYSNDFHHPHNDSIHDIIVYSAMLEELDANANEKDKS